MSLSTGAATASESISRGQRCPTRPGADPRLQPRRIEKRHDGLLSTSLRIGIPRARLERDSGPAAEPATAFSSSSVQKSWLRNTSASSVDTGEGPASRARPPSLPAASWTLFSLKTVDGRFSTDGPTIRSVSPAELAAEFHQLRELAPAFGVRTLGQRSNEPPRSDEVRRPGDTRTLRNSCLRKSARFSSPERHDLGRHHCHTLGPIPGDPRELEMWAMEHRGAVVLLAGLADWDAALLKRAALGVANEWTNRRASELLMDAAQECG